MSKNDKKLKKCSGSIIDLTKDWYTKDGTNYVFKKGLLIGQFIHGKFIPLPTN